MALIGMDVDAVNQLASDLHGQAGAIDQVIATVNNLLSHSQDIWKGTDATNFLGWWEQQHRPALMHVRDAISGLGQSASNNASEQSNVSGH
jgi:WXG100 family type VII secretion target